MSTFNLDMTTDQILAEFYIEGTTGGPAAGNIAVLNLDGNVANVLRGDGTFGAGGGGTATVAGANGTIQYNANGNLGGISGVTSDGTKLTVNGIANLSITGGSNGQMITTDGSGNLTFRTVPGYINLPRIELATPPVDTLDASFTDPMFAYYNNNVRLMNIAVNGILMDPDAFTLVGNTLTYLGWSGPNTYLDVLAQTVAIANTDLSGNINAYDITCNSITGDGSGLTNIPSSTKISNGTTSVNTLSTGSVKIIADGADMVNVDQNAMEVNGDLYPAANIVYDLGSATRRWKDLYLSNNTIYLNETSLSADANGLSVGGSTMATQDYVGNTITSTVNKSFVDGLAVSANTANVAALANVATVANSVALGNVTGIGNIANINLDGNVGNVLSGNGTFVKFGNVGAIDLDGNVGNVLAGDGTWTQNRLAGGNTGEIQFNSSNTLSGSNRLSYSGNLLSATTDSGSAILALKYSNSSTSAFTVGRARGTKASPSTVQVGDGIQIAAGTFYTGNGAATLDGLSGWVTGASTIEARITALPGSSGQPPTTEIRIGPTLSGNTSVSPTIQTSVAQTTIRGNVILPSTNADGTSKYVPASSTSSGTTGQLAWDATYLYICIGTNQWQRVQHQTW